MKYLNKIIIIFFLLFSTNLKSGEPYFLDFKLILNQSTAGKKAQDFLQKKLKNGLDNLRKKEKEIQEEEKNIINQKKIISPEDYKKKVNVLRNKVNSLQEQRKNLLENVSKERTKARNVLLKNLNPIISSYMKEKNIRMVIDKKSLLLADERLNITDDIMKILNKQLKSIDLK